MSRATPNWTPEAEAMIRARYVQVGPSVLAAELGLTLSAVKAKAHRMGVSVPKPSNRDWIHLRRERILREHWMKEPPYVTAKRLNRTLPDTAQEALALGLPPDTWQRRQGRDNGRERMNYAPADLAPPRIVRFSQDTIAWANSVGIGNPEAKVIAIMLHRNDATVSV
jgi:hypothetical protein